LFKGKWAAFLAYKKAANSMCNDIKHSVREDRNSMLKSRLAEAAQIGDIRGLSMLQKELRPLVACRKPSGAALRPLPITRDGSGKLAGSQEERSNMFAHQFAGQELGVETTIDAFHENAQAKQCEAVKRRGSYTLQASEVATRTEVNIPLNTGKEGRAVGLDTLSQEMQKADPDSFADIFHPLALKSGSPYVSPYSPKADS
jgi:hypothetical protein